MRCTTLGRESCRPAPAGRRRRAIADRVLARREQRRAASRLKPSDAPVLRDAAAQLDAYFRGERREFDLDLKPTGTAFQLAVLNALATIPYGETRSYGEIASQIGRPKAVRAVGAANGRNPLPIVIPCHRVIGADGSLTGFGGGLETKRYLLELETRTLSLQQRVPI